MLRTRRVENLRHGALTTTAGTREGSTITATASPHPCCDEPSDRRRPAAYSRGQLISTRRFADCKSHRPAARATGDQQSM